MQANLHCLASQLARTPLALKLQYSLHFLVKQPTLIQLLVKHQANPRYLELLQARLSLGARRTPPSLEHPRGPLCLVNQPLKTRAFSRHWDSRNNRLNSRLNNNRTSNRHQLSVSVDKIHLANKPTRVRVNLHYLASQLARIKLPVRLQSNLLYLAKRLTLRQLPVKHHCLEPL